MLTYAEVWSWKYYVCEPTSLCEKPLSRHLRLTITMKWLKRESEVVVRSGGGHQCNAKNYCYLYNFYKSLFKLSDWNPRHPIQRHRTGLKLVLGWMFSGYSLGSSRDFTEVRPVLAAGGRSAHRPEPRTEPLETDLGTVIKLLSINI